MKILGIDTSSMAASVAVIEDDRVTCEFIVNDKNTHSQKLMPMIDSMLKISGEDINSMDLIAVCIGPGSFTGIRIGVSTAKAIAHVNDIPIVAVNSLEAISENLGLTNKIIVPIYDAQKDQVYVGEYLVDGKDIINKVEIDIKNIDSLLEDLKNRKEEFLIAGEAVYKHKDKFEGIDNIEVADSIYNVSKGSSICQLAMKKFSKEKDIHNCYDINPMYIKKSQAEIQLEERKIKNSK